MSRYRSQRRCPSGADPSGLGFKDLEEDFLKASLSGENPPAELRLLLAGVYATQKEPAAALFSAQRAAPAYPQMAFSDLPKEIVGFSISASVLETRPVASPPEQT